MHSLIDQRDISEGKTVQELPENKITGTAIITIANFKQNSRNFKFWLKFGWLQ